MLRFANVGGKHFGGVFHLIFIMLALSNSFINPILYGMCSSKYRSEFKEVLNAIACKLIKCSYLEIDVSTDMTNDNFNRVQSTQEIV